MVRSHRNMVKSGKSRLKIILRHANLHHDLHHHLITTPPSSTVPIHFVRQTGQRFVDKEENVEIGEEQKVKGEEELLVDHRFFFQFQQEYSSYKTISAVLDNLGVKFSLRYPITNRVLDFGRRLKMKKKAFLGIVVSLISIDTFLGDQVSVHGYMQRLRRKSEAQVRANGGLFAS